MVRCPRRAAAIAIQRGDADQRRGAAIQLAELGQFGEQRPGEGRADAGYTAQQIVLHAPDRTVLNLGGEVVVDFTEAALEPANVLPQVPLHRPVVACRSAGARRSASPAVDGAAPRGPPGLGWPRRATAAVRRVHARAKGARTSASIEISFRRRPSACAKARTCRGLTMATGTRRGNAAGDRGFVAAGRFHHHHRGLNARDPGAIVAGRLGRGTGPGSPRREHRDDDSSLLTSIPTAGRAPTPRASLSSRLPALCMCGLVGPSTVRDERRRLRAEPMLDYGVDTQRIAGYPLATLCTRFRRHKEFRRILLLS